MADQQIVNDTTDAKAQIKADVEHARSHQNGRQDLEVMAGHDKTIQALTPRAEEKETAPPKVAMSSADADELRKLDGFNREVRAVEAARDIAYDSSRERINITKVNGEPDARDNLRNSYNDLVNHMKDHPELAAQEGAVMRNFQQVANGAAHKGNLSEDQRDNLLANMLHAHVNGVSTERISTMYVTEQGGPSL